MNGRHRFARLALAAGAAVVILAAGVPARADHSVDPSADQAPATEPPAEEPLPGDEPPVTEPPVEEPPPETPPVEDPTVTSPPPDRDGPVGSQQAGSEATREAAPTRLGDFPPAVGSVTIHKRGDGFDPLGGATFELLDYPLGTPTCTTDTEGVCTLSDLIPGSYRVHEATAPGGFSPIDNITQSGTPSDYAKPVTVSAAADTSDVSFVNVRDNAPSAGGCGINIVLVLDRSGSVAPFASDYIAAANAFVDALVGTPSQIAVVSFAGQASVDSGYVDVSGGAGGLPATINGVYGSVGGGTNWAGAFDATAGLGGADAAIMVTDGNPTSPNEPLGPVEEGVTAANLVKAGGTHVYAIGIGGASNLPLIGDAIPGGVGELQTILVNLAMEFCSGALQVVKTSTVDPAARLAGAQFKLQERQGEVPTWVDTLGTCTTDASGACTFGELAVGTEYRVVEVSPPAGYDLPAQRRQLVSIAGGETTTLTFADPPLPPPPPPPPPPPDDIIVTTPVGTVTVPTPTPPGPVGPRSLT